MPNHFAGASSVGSSVEGLAQTWSHDAHRRSSSFAAQEISALSMALSAVEDTARDDTAGHRGPAPVAESAAPDVAL